MRQYEKRMALLRDANMAAAVACMCGSILFLLLHFVEQDRERALEHAWRARWTAVLAETDAAWARAHNQSAAAARNLTAPSMGNSTLAAWLREMEYYAVVPHGPTPP